MILVQNEADVDALDLPPDTPVAYVTQTTLSVDDTQGIIAALQRKFTDIVGPETRDICYATQNRQSAVRELCKRRRRHPRGRRDEQLQFQSPARDRQRGGHAELSDRRRQRARPEWLEGVQTVGITAGASAPEVLVDDVIDGLRRLGPVDVSCFPGARRTIEFRLPAELAKAS